MCCMIYLYNVHVQYTRNVPYTCEAYYKYVYTLTVPNYRNKPKDQGPSVVLTQQIHQHEPLSCAYTADLTKLKVYSVGTCLRILLMPYLGLRGWEDDLCLRVLFNNIKRKVN